MAEARIMADTREQGRRLLRELVHRELARRDFGAYLSLVHGSAWIPTRFSSFLAGEAQRFLEEDTGGAYEILIVETPPQHGKSMTLTESLPSWYMMRNPEKRVILVSYNEESAERFSRRNREKLRDWGKILFGVELGGLNRSTEYELAGHRGRLISRGMMSGITGHAADLVIIDDPIKNREEADSPAYRGKLWGEWVNSVKSRLAAHARVIVIMTPWHEDDLAARLLRTEKHIRLLRLPVEAEPTQDAPDPLGRAAGEPLCPELGKGTKWLRQFKASYLSDPFGGQRAWMALYLCRPRAEQGNLVRREWWRYHTGTAEPSRPSAPFTGKRESTSTAENTGTAEKTWTAEGVVPLPSGFGTMIVSVDATFKGGEQNDFVAITVWGKRGEDYFLLDCLNRHLTFTQTLTAIRETQRRFPAARAVLIEDKANGSAIIDVLRRDLFCIPVEPKGGKEARVHGVSAAIEAGHVFLPRRAPWLEEYLNQWTSFPSGAHDDMVDSSSQALLYLFSASGGENAPSPEEQVRLAAEEEERAAFVGGDAYDYYGY